MINDINCLWSPTSISMITVHKRRTTYFGLPCFRYGQTSAFRIVSCGQYSRSCKLMSKVEVWRWPIRHMNDWIHVTRTNLIGQRYFYFWHRLCKIFVINCTVYCVESSHVTLSEGLHCSDGVSAGKIPIARKYYFPWRCLRSLRLLWYRELQVAWLNNFLLAHAHSEFLYTNCCIKIIVCACTNSKFSVK